MPEDNPPAEPVSVVAREQAFQLARAAVALDKARHQRDRDPVGLVSALNNNLEVWIALRALVERDDCPLSEQVRENLTRLGNFVAQKTFDSPDGLADASFDTLININLQISEGLLEGLKTAGTAGAA